MLRKVFIALSLLGLTLFAGCQSDDSDGESEHDSISGIDNDLLLELVNGHRATGCKCGSSEFGPTNPIVWNDAIEWAAYDHSLDMYENKFLGHKGSDGSNAGTRLKRRDYSYKRWGENVAKGYKTENSVINAWKNSAGHCRNMMSPNFTEMGIAKVGIYWTQVLAAPK